MNLANKLTIGRVALIPFFLIVLYVVEKPLNLYIGVVIFIVAALTDLLDGHIARSRNLITDFGKFMDPLADKLLVASALIYMVETGMIWAWIVIVIISREFIVSGIRLVAASKGTVLAASIWGKIKTATTMVMIVVVLLPLEWSFVVYLDWILIIASTFFTILSGYDYVYKNRAIFKGSM